MAQTQQLSFELERFEWVAADRLEVVGRWQGIRGRRLARPVLTVEAAGTRRRLTAMPGGQLTGEESWRAAFAWPHEPAEIEAAELEIGRSVVVELPVPRSRKRRGRTDDGGVRAELAELRSQIAELREERSAAVARAEAAEADADAEIAEAAPDAAPDPAALAELSVLRERNEALERDLDSLRDRHDALQEELGALKETHDGLGDQHAALISRSGDLRGELDETLAENERHSAQLGELQETRMRLQAELEARDEDLAGARAELARVRADLDQRLEAERADAAARLEHARAGQAEIHEKLATAREEAAKALAAEADETERVRAELAAAREDAERLLAAERAEVTRLREELATRPAMSEDPTEETDEASRRMYERISAELDRERSTVRELRRELDSSKAQTAEHRRSAAAAATNGVHAPAGDAPLAATPAGRASSRRAAAVLAARARSEQQAPYRRVDAARVAAAGRVPEHEQSATSVWGLRAAALLLVAVLLLALVIVVSAVT